MSIYYRNQNGFRAVRATLEAARTAIKCANTTIIVDSSLTTVQSNINGPWPTDRALEVKTGGKINNTTAFTTTGALTMSGGKFGTGSTGAITINGPFSGNGDSFVGSGTVICPSLGQYFKGGTPIGGVTQDLPLANSLVVYNGYDNPPTNTWPQYGVVSQLWSGITPTPSPLWSEAGYTDVAHNTIVAGSFTGHRGGVSGTSLMALNPMVSWDARPSGVININGINVTWVSGSKFLTGTGWQSAYGTIGPDITTPLGSVGFTIKSVTDDQHMVLTADAGIHTGWYYAVGGATIAEFDMNSKDDYFGGSGMGVIIASGSTNKTGTALAIGAAPNHTGADNASWYDGAIITEFRHIGLTINPVQTDTPGAIGFDVINGPTGGSYIHGGAVALTLTGSVGNLLSLWPSVDNGPVPVIQGTNAAGTRLWTISQNGGTLGVHPTRNAIIYSGYWTPNLSLGSICEVMVATTVTMTINTPINSTVGQELTIRIYNTSGAPLPALNWGSSYKLSAWVQPAAGMNRAIMFDFDGIFWHEKSRTSADIPN